MTLSDTPPLIECALCCPDASLVEAPTTAAERDALLARFAKAAGHPARIAILRVLAERKSCVCGEIVEVLPLAQSTVSQHLKVLKEAGLIQGTIAPPRTCYCIDPNAIAMFKALVGTL